MIQAVHAASFPVALAICASITALLAGCPNARHYPGPSIESLSDSQLIRGVPLIHQSRQFQCGYACVTSVAVYYGVSPARFATGTIPDAYGKRMLSAKQIASMSQTVGLVGFGYKGDLNDLTENIAKKRPVLVLLDGPPRTATWPSIEWAGETAAAGLNPPHWVIVIGFTGKAGDVVISDPRQGLLSMPRAAFLQAWKKLGYVSVLVGVRASPTTTSGPCGPEER